MEVDNLDEIISHLKKMNDEVIQCKMKSDVDFKAYNELTAQYLAKTRELEESTKKIEHLKRLCKVLEEKLGKFLTIHSDYQKLTGRMKRMQRKLELTIRENKSYERELEEVKSAFHSTSSRDKSVAKIMELQETLKERENEYQNSLERVRSEARRSLITLESKILEKLKNEHTNDDYNTISDEVKRKLVDNEYVIEALNLANLKLKEKLELKEYQYQELENNYLLLKVNSQHKQKSNDNIFFGPKEDRTDSFNRKLMAKNIEEVIKELKSATDSKELKSLSPANSGSTENEKTPFGTSRKSSDGKYQCTVRNKSTELHANLTKDASLESFIFPVENDTVKNRKYQSDYYDFIEEIFVGHRAMEEDQNSTEMSDNESFDHTEDLMSLRDIDGTGEFKIDIKENEISVEVKRCCNSESSSMEKLMDFKHCKKS